MSSGTWRQDAWRLRQTISPPIGSACEVSPGTPSIGMKYSAGLTRYSCPSARRRMRCRAVSSSTAASISAVLTP
jgi:hypothetical protein